MSAEPFEIVDDRDPHSHLQWAVYYLTLTDLLEADGLSETGLRHIRHELRGGQWDEDALPAGPWAAQRRELLEAVGGRLTAIHPGLESYYAEADGLAIPDTVHGIVGDVGGECDDDHGTNA